MSETVSETPAPVYAPFEPKVRKPKSKWLIPAIALVVGLAVGGGVGAAANDKSAKVANLNSQLETAKSTIGSLSSKVDKYESNQAALDKEATDLAAQKATLDQQVAAEADKHKTDFADGVFLVNRDIQPGTYRSSQGDGCYYARLRGTGGTLGDIITNGNPSGQTVITIAPSDVAFDSERCGTWTKVG